MAKKNNPAVSVIIAMFNAEKYIGECLTSLANQTLQDFEIIVADDCSTDNSRAVVENFFANFGGRLKLLELPENSGRPGIPRNFALEAACGKYVYFLDSDDLLTETALAELYIAAEKFSADVVHAEKCFVYEKVDGEFINEPASTQTGDFVEVPTLETSDTGERVNAFIQKRFLWWGCNKLFRRKFLEENEIKFPQMTSFEDLVFCFQCVVAAKNYVRVPFNNYYYRIRKNSLSHKGVDGVQITNNLKEAIKVLDGFMSDKKFFKDNPQHRYAVLDFFAQERIETIANNIFIHNNFNTGEFYDFLCREMFLYKPEENVALTSYLFTTAGIYKLFIKQQANQIAELQSQLAKSQG